jgi:hypothetical protein
MKPDSQWWPGRASAGELGGTEMFEPDGTEVVEALAVDGIGGGSPGGWWRPGWLATSVVVARVVRGVGGDGPGSCRHRWWQLGRSAAWRTSSDGGRNSWIYV